MIRSIVVHDIPADSVAVVEPGCDLVSSFLLERPTDDFLRDLRTYLP